jgi:hypothetical protein
MFQPPSIGDKFAYPNTDHPIGTIERVTKTSDGTIWLWSGDYRYPWHQCEPIGVWQALALEFVADLLNCTTYAQVTDLLGSLEDTDRQTVWNACPPALRATIHRLKNESSPPVEPIEFKPLPPIHKSNAKTEARKATVA